MRSNLQHTMWRKRVVFHHSKDVLTSQQAIGKWIITDNNFPEPFFFHPFKIQTNPLSHAWMTGYYCRQLLIREGKHVFSFPTFWRFLHQVWRFLPDAKNPFKSASALADLDTVCMPRKRESSVWCSRYRLLKLSSSAVAFFSSERPCGQIWFKVAPLLEPLLIAQTGLQTPLLSSHFTWQSNFPSASEAVTVYWFVWAAFFLLLLHNRARGCHRRFAPVKHHLNICWSKTVVLLFFFLFSPSLCFCSPEILSCICSVFIPVSRLSLVIPLNKQPALFCSASLTLLH